MSAYMPHQTQQQQLSQAAGGGGGTGAGYPSHPMQMHQQMQGPPVRSQSSRDIIRQEAKLQEMQEEVRRRELRGGDPNAQMNAYRSNTYNPRISGPLQQQQHQTSSGRPGPGARPLGSTPNLGPTSPSYNNRQPGAPNYGYISTDSQQQYPGQYPGQFNKPQQQYLPPGSSGRPYGQNGAGSQYTQNGGPDQSHTDGDFMTSDNPPARPALPHTSTSSSTPPPPVPNTLTHPLYAKQMESSSTR